MNNVAVNNPVHVLEYTLSGRIAGLKAKSMRNCQTSFQTAALFYIPPVVYESPIFPPAYEHSLLSLFLIIINLVGVKRYLTVVQILLYRGLFLVACSAR